MRLRSVLALNISHAGLLCRHLGTLVTRNNNQLCDYLTIEPSRLAGILGSRLTGLEIAQDVITLARKTEPATEQRVARCSCAAPLHL